MHEISWIEEYYTGQSIPSMTCWNRRWFQDLINVWTMPATVLKNKVMYRQLIHSVAFVNSKCCTCLRPLCLYFPDTPRTPYFYHLTWILIKTIWFWTVGWSPHTINVFVSLQLPPWRWPYEWPKLAGCHYEIKLRSLYQSAFVGVLNKFCIFLSSFLTLRLLMSYIYMELLVKPEMLTSYIYGPTLGNAETVSFYLLHNVSTLNQCREVSCVTFVCKHFAS